jgi:hypothetical protein
LGSEFTPQAIVKVETLVEKQRPEFNLVKNDFHVAESFLIELI